MDGASHLEVIARNYLPGIVMVFSLLFAKLFTITCFGNLHAVMQSEAALTVTCTPNRCLWFGSRQPSVPSF